MSTNTPPLLFLVLALTGCAAAAASSVAATPAPLPMANESTPPAARESARDESQLSLASEQARYAALHSAACQRLHAPATELIEKAVKTPEAAPLVNPPPGESKASPEPGPSAQTIRSVVHAQFPRIQTCVDDALSSGWPDLHGHISVRFAILGTGAVGPVAIANDETGVEPLLCCVAEVFESLQFPAANVKDFVIVTWPLNIAGGAQ
jgi:hypothetical protein